jgi:hypothetical protein
MIIHKKRIRNIAPYLHRIPIGNKVVIGITDPKRFLSKMQQIGFPESLGGNQSILPSGSFGPISRYNAEGKELVHKDQPMETVSRQAEWHWEEWDGRYNTITRSKIVDIPYQRYPRTFVSPPAVELTLAEGTTGQLILVGPAIENTKSNIEALIHLANLFLEIFGECQFFTENLDTLMPKTITRLNWEIFPQGEVPWDRLKKHLDPLIKQAPKGNQPVLLDRLEKINKMSPDFIAVGRGGFHGYIVHGFINKDLFVLESMYYGNATYVFGEKWEELSKKTKAEILNDNLQKARIIHSEGWSEKVEQIVKN